MPRALVRASSYASEETRCSEGDWEETPKNWRPRFHGPELGGRSQVQSASSAQPRTPLRTQLCSKASLFVPQAPAAPRDPSGNGPPGVVKAIQALVRKTFQGYLRDLYMFDTEQHTTVRVELANLPIYSQWPEEHEKIARSRAIGMLVRAIMQGFGSQAANTRPMDDGTSCCFDYICGDPGRLCWEFVKGCCPRPNCRWEHAMPLTFVISVIIAPAETPSVQSQYGVPQPWPNSSVTFVPVFVPEGSTLPEVVFQQGMAQPGLPLMNLQPGAPCQQDSRNDCEVVSPGASPRLAFQPPPLLSREINEDDPEDEGVAGCEATLPPTAWADIPEEDCQEHGSGC